MIRLICLICLICPSLAIAQQVPTPPPENRRPHLSIFTTDLYRSIPEEAALVDAFDKDPQLKQLKSQTNFHHFTNSGPLGTLYKARFSKVIPPDRFPAILLQRADGGYVYKATGSNVPSSPSAIFDEMAHYAKLDPLTGPADSKEARPWFRPLRDISYQLQGVADVDGPPQDCPDCPDGRCPVPDDTAPSYPDSSNAPLQPDSVELGGRHPVRETGALVVILIGLLIGGFVLVCGGIILLGIVWLVSRAVR